MTARTSDDLAALLRALRRRHARQQGDGELTYRELAARTGWSHTAIAEYLTGKTLPPTDRLDALVRLLGATPAEQGALATARDRIEESRRRAARVPDRMVPRQLPADVASFAGRDDELARLDKLVAAPTAVVVAAISGTAGVGKTALAVHWAHRVADRFDDGQLYVNLRGFDPRGPALSAATALRGFLDALGVPAARVPTDLDAQAALYRSALADKRILIVLDNARDAEQVRPLLPGTPTTMVLVTSRDQLTSLVSLDGAQPLPLNLLTRDAASHLLTNRLGVERVTAEPEAVEAIIAACARLPLALSIAAARAQQSGFPLGTLASELGTAGQRFGVLNAGDAVGEVRAVFSWSYRALTPPAAGLFRLLGLHPGPDITVPAAASLAGLAADGTRRSLTELTRANLLAEYRPGRFTAHDLLRAYAAELSDGTDPAPDRVAATVRLLDHYTHTAYVADELLRPQSDPVDHLMRPPAAGVDPERPTTHAEALAWLSAEHPVLLAALRQSADAGFDAHTWRLGRALDTFLDRQGHWHDRVETCQAALLAAERLGDPAAQAVAHRFLAGAHTVVNRYADALGHLERALDLYVRAGDVEGEARTHQNLASLWDRQGEPRKALEHSKRTLVLAQAAGHRRAQADALNAVGWCLAQLGDHLAALTYCEQALDLLRQLGDQAGEAATWDSLGYAHHHLGQYDRAVECYERTLELARDLGDRWGEADTLSRLGDTRDALGDPTSARADWQRALDIFTALQHPDADAVRARLHLA
ncbi:ATP-binding protein [Micromonospora chokoriensis]|uniref:ATP-binding protein n=1 Tax=Micromonospora chokoriensis TaxID=356851 RepID=UPI00068F8C90|nr:tetratricopeptide repeat protein [Micromonospora chokoriensis]